MGLFVLAVLSFRGFRCADDSEIDAEASSLIDCSRDDCEASGEECHDGTDCEGDTAGDECIVEVGDDLCHVDCTGTESCASGEDCTYVGGGTSLCL